MEKVPFATRETVERIAAVVPTPFHLYSERIIRERARRLAAAFSWNASFREFFAVKATPTPQVLRILAEEGCGADCATASELVMARACGLAGERVMLSSNDTPARDFRLARRLGAFVNLDAAELVGPLEEALGGRLPEVVCLRLNPGGSFVAGSAIIGEPEDSKFGMTRAQLDEAVRALRERGVRTVGLHALLASNALGDAYYPALARLLFRTAAELERDHGVRVAFCDLSGGVGVAYRPEEHEPDIEAVGALVREAAREELGEAAGRMAVFAELGRWLLAPAGALVTRVIHEKRTYRDYLGVDACSADLMRPAMYGAYHHVSVLGREGEEPERRYSVVGGLCENNDQLARDRMLPRTGPGDVLWIHDTGAHGRSMGYNYNGRLRSAEVLLREDGSFSLMRRAETQDDLFATLDVDDAFLRGLGEARRALGAPVARAPWDETESERG